MSRTPKPSAMKHFNVDSLTSGNLRGPLCCATAAKLNNVHLFYVTFHLRRRQQMCMYNPVITLLPANRRWMLLIFLQNGAAVTSSLRAVSPLRSSTSLSSEVKAEDGRSVYRLLGPKTHRDGIPEPVSKHWDNPRRSKSRLDHQL